MEILNHAITVRDVMYFVSGCIGLGLLVILFATVAVNKGWIK